MTDFRIYFRRLLPFFCPHTPPWPSCTHPPLTLPTHTVDHSARAGWSGRAKYFFRFLPHRTVFVLSSHLSLTRLLSSLVRPIPLVLHSFLPLLCPPVAPLVTPSHSSRSDIDWYTLPSQFLRVVPTLIPPLRPSSPLSLFLVLSPQSSSATPSSSPSPFLVVSALPTGILHSLTPKSVVFYFLSFLLTCMRTHTHAYTSLVRPF